eukprot:TRINITY_DN7145_c0_g1_i7.p1 TRINITY_DN7145_c0_g1~~TRINITY_DN7145_c0_g1_i7.p1  ORF type:complete len:246 (-),score=20.13 TRINITY_DN7145_c0_g1_i7:241-978(-)
MDWQYVRDPTGLTYYGTIARIIFFLALANLGYLLVQLLGDLSFWNIVVLIYYYVSNIFALLILDKDERYSGGPSELVFGIKCLIFRMMEAFYFVCLLPFKVHDDQISFDGGVSVWIGVFATANAGFLYAFYFVWQRSEELREQSCALGYWTRKVPTRSPKLSNFEDLDSPANGVVEKEVVLQWVASDLPYPKGFVVRHNNELYVASCKRNSANPATSLPRLLHVTIKLLSVTVCRWFSNGIGIQG